MKNVNKLSDTILTDRQKRYIQNIYDSNELTIFPDVTQRKLLEIIDELASKLNEYGINDDKNRLL